MYAVRRWSVRHAGGLRTIYQLLEKVLIVLHPLWSRIGYARMEKPVAAIERATKGLLFDCRMCGQCTLSDTGMSCPMNCPKNLRNGPCCGVRADGHCEVKPGMQCVWVEAIAGSQLIGGDGAGLRTVQAPVHWQLQGRSSWLRVAREKAGAGNEPR